MKLNLDSGLVENCRAAAQKIAADVQDFIRDKTTVAVERAILRLLGINDAADGVPLANIVVDAIAARGELNLGAAYWVGNACKQLGLSPAAVAQQVAAGELDLFALPRFAPEELHPYLRQLARPGLQRIADRRREREEMLARLPMGPAPWLYVIVATGDIMQDVVQAQAAAEQGADIIAVIRTTGQSLLDYVPHGATREGFGGTYATQENFRIMRKALDEVGERLGRYIMLVNYCSGLCMPEIAALGALERLDMMLNDALYGILFRDINMQRTLIDQNFSRTINAYAGIIINTGEDNYLTTADAVAEAHTVTASQFINEQLALAAGLRPWQMGLGHAFEIDPDLEDGLLLEIAQALLARQLFPQAPLKYMPPTKHMTGNIFKGYLLNGLFNLTSVLTGQGIHLLGMLTEAIHTPFLQDRYLALEGAKYVMNNARHLGQELEIRAGGKIEGRAREVLAKAAEFLARVADIGLFAALEQGMFAAVKRSRDGGKGLEGVVMQAQGYCNPFLEEMSTELREAQRNDGNKAD
ncbi:MAG: D-lysine 5,6-aminomutase subunit alpha [Firmicutes bacterium]|nr:D-lysine 5,6-aminomutase subunit alpha [Bacillota bacterium]HOB34906.1 lysine 5,6-aminomutase subunit alpha [Bacillota bacterium]HPZ91126.1 lysine 5,6-aminomutase subunit alpha [Bacillota bacterium]HQE02017.1 lysine 5,6-aminomutase subunit alpha [Bacillota bacterium]